jgi:hypothetical protein
MHFTPEKWLIQQLMVPSESAPNELFTEWSGQRFENLKFFGQFLCPALGGVTISR